MPHRPVGCKRKILRTLSLVLAFLLLAELGLRVVGWYYLNRVYGHPAPAGGINVVCLGESSTEGLWTGPGETYPDQLEVLLRERVSPRVNVVVPPHVGQNSSQVAARVPDYLQRYHPRLVIIMVGINNEWALRESNIGRFVPEDYWIRAQIALDELRLFRVGRWFYLRLTVHDKDPDAVKGEGYAVYGHPGFTRYPPPREIVSFADSHIEAFMQLWRYDVRRIIDEVKAGGATPLLMTYHIPGFVPVEEFIKMAEETHTPLVRNDLTFAELAKNGTLDQYVFQQDHWHPNKQGYTLIAKNVFDLITRQNLLGPPVKIAVWHNLPSGGGKRQLYNHVQGLLAEGHHVEAWRPDTADQKFLPLGELVKEHVVPLAKKPEPKWYDAIRPLWVVRDMVETLDRHYRACAAEIQAGHFDLLYAGACLFLRTSGIAEHLRIPTAIYLGEPYRWFYEALPELPWISPQPLSASPRGLRAFAENHALLAGIRSQALTERDQARRFGRVLVNSLYSRECMLRTYDIDARVCRLGIDVDTYRPTGEAKERFVLGVGTIYHGKGVDRAIRAVGALPYRERPPLVWVGNGANEADARRFRELASALAVELIIRENISDAEVISLMSRAQVMIYPPRLEPFGLAPLEANACGTAVVGIAEGGVRESVRPGKNGELVERDDPELWVEALMPLLDRRTAEERGAAARQYVAAHWTLAQSTRNLVGALGL